MNSSPDAQLITDAIGGDPVAIEQLLDRYHPSVTRFARKFCATPEDVEDAVQETLWIAAQRIGTLRVASAFTSWLFEVVRHQCLRLLRLTQPTNSMDARLEILPSVENPERQIMLRHDLARAIAVLPPSQMHVFLLRDLEGRSAGEVAATLGLTVMSVKSRLHRARVTLRQTLQQWHEEGC
ncbi:RNA polymerase sigma24 factor [Ktedonobacter sp. SOSP1-52]|uniref:RNA polymerase sigma factor n=1 Tax=Ktedonobacter sp. SOSP1-52 TaxID=2778366 RepID=UPI0019155D6A|nr:sigma-70 family RNA polymerase sigma factor [Ktedonobacter sp. SOSP1-52]GHO61676.1 RNA polymerase sigma24 factor [Ktedonobacter sp. SOSP1-52]